MKLIDGMTNEERESLRNSYKIKERKEKLKAMKQQKETEMKLMKQQTSEMKLSSNSIIKQIEDETNTKMKEIIFDTNWVTCVSSEEKRFFSISCVVIVVLGVFLSEIFCHFITIFFDKIEMFLLDNYVVTQLRHKYASKNIFLPTQLISVFGKIRCCTKYF